MYSSQSGPDMILKQILAVDIYFLDMRYSVQVAWQWATATRLLESFFAKIFFNPQPRPLDAVLKGNLKHSFQLDGCATNLDLVHRMSTSFRKDTPLSELFEHASEHMTIQHYLACSAEITVADWEVRGIVHEGDEGGVIIEGDALLFAAHSAPSFRIASATHEAITERERRLSKRQASMSRQASLKGMSDIFEPDSDLSSLGSLGDYIDW